MELYRTGRIKSLREYARGLPSQSPVREAPVKEPGKLGQPEHQFLIIDCPADWAPQQLAQYVPDGQPAWHLMANAEQFKAIVGMPGMVPLTILATKKAA